MEKNIGLLYSFKMYNKNNMDDINIINNKTHDINDKFSDNKSNDESKQSNNNLISKVSVNTSHSSSDKLHNISKNPNSKIIQ